MPQGFGSPIEPKKIVRFGMFGFVVNKVMFGTSGDSTSYTLPGILNRDGELRQFKGKRLATAQEIANAGKTIPGSKDRYKSPTDHLLVVMRAKNRDGEEYLKVYDMVCINKDPKWQVLGKSLQAVFGDNYGEVVKPAPQLKQVTWLPCKTQEVPTGGKWSGTDGSDHDEMALKFVEQFADEKAMRDAEAKHFAQFGGNDAETVAVSPDVINAARKLLTQLKGNEPKFLDMVEKDIIANASSQFAGCDPMALLEAAKA